MLEFLSEIWDEATDFFEDIFEHLVRRPEKHYTREVEIGGVRKVVRPAYLFAEKVENLIKLIFGVSLCISAFTATFLGFASLSQLVGVLMDTLFGRVTMFIIGISYLLIAFWKILHTHTVS